MINDNDPRAPVDQLEKELQKLRVRFSDKLPGRLRELSEEWESLQGGGWNEDGARALHRSVHGLIGTAGSLGFAQVSKSARVVERLLLGLLESAAVPAAAQNDEVHGLLASIGEAVEEDEKALAEGSAAEIQRVPAAQIFEARNLIVVVEREGPFAHELALQLGHFGFELQMYQNLDAVAEADFGRRPAAVIVDLSVPEGEVAAVEAAQFVRNTVGEDVPVVFVSNRSDIEARLDAVRAGCRGYFVKPVNYSGVLETLDRLTRCEPDPYRILIVDDETETAEFHSLSLEAAGLETVIVNEPLDVTAQLVEFHPDVILIDLYMPGCSGQELAKVIRQEEAFVGVPIVFLSRETDRMKQIAALGETGDDFFTKPVPPDELVSAVSARAQRGRTLRLFMERDGLTGLFSHSRVIEQLEIAVRRADRHHGSLAVAMLDIDGFKEVNDSYGHLQGDQVLKALAYLLRQRLRISDVLGRYGGDECLIVFPETTAEAAVEKMNDIRRNFAAVEHDTGDGSFSVTVSCGVSEFPQALTSHELIAAADEALYQAKNAGRNRVVHAGRGE